VSDLAAAAAAAFWLGILTAISPCPLATNIAAVSYIGRDLTSAGRVVLSGLLYAAGRTAAYIAVAALVVTSILSIPSVAQFLQVRMNQLLGPLLIVTGAIVLGWVRIPLSWSGSSEALRKRVAGAGTWGAGLLGVLFALSFCPISAGLFFGSLIPLSAGSGSRVVVPGFFGLGTGLPVVALAVALGLGMRRAGQLFRSLTSFERWARVCSGVVFLVVGLYFVSTRILGWGA